MVGCDLIRFDLSWYFSSRDNFEVSKTQRVYLVVFGFRTYPMVVYMQLPVYNSKMSRSETNNE